MEPPKGAPLNAGSKKIDKTPIELFSSHIVTNNRLTVILFLLSIGFIILGITLYQVFPLKTVVPYILEAHDDGNVTVNRDAAKPFVPGEKEKRYFLGRWVIMTYTLDRARTDEYLQTAYLFTRGKAIREFEDFLRNTEKPIVKLELDPTLTREVEINSVSFPKPDIAMVRITTTARSLNQQNPIIKKHLFTIHHIVEPVDVNSLITLANGKKTLEIDVNPIGLKILHFEISEDFGQ